MKHTFVAMVLLAVAVTCAQAQSAGTSVSNPNYFSIPFAFYAGEKLCPAGEYRVSIQADNRLLIIVGKSTPLGIYLLATIDEHRPNATPTMVFRTYDNQTYFLARTHLPGRGVMQIPRAKVEFKYVAGLNRVREVTVASK